MKIRESGMPEERLWKSFFSPEETLRKLGLEPTMRDVVDFGCGFGTFAVPAARIVSGTVYALEIDSEMVAAVRRKASEQRLDNLLLVERDFVADGTGLPAASVNFAMLLNILHAEQPTLLTGEAFRVLRPGGVLAVMHWQHDPATPRGPSMAIRPRPEQCAQWCREVGFVVGQETVVSLPPYHYGFKARKP